MTTKLRVVANEAPPVEPDPSLAYEYEERRRIAARDWAAVHIAGDRRAPICLPDKAGRGWRG